MSHSWCPPSLSVYQVCSSANQPVSSLVAVTKGNPAWLVQVFIIFSKSSTGG